MRPVCFLTYPPGPYTTWSPWAKRQARNRSGGLDPDKVRIIRGGGM